MIRLVAFDFWQTLFSEDPATANRVHAHRLVEVGRALARAGRGYEAGALASADTRAAWAFAEIWGRDESMTAAEQVRVFLGLLEPGLPAALSARDGAAVAEAYEEAVLAHPPEIAGGAAAAIEALAGGGRRLAVISNTGRTPGRVLRALLERAGVLSRFDVLSFSDEVGARKPAAEIFQRTLASAGIEAREAVHLGDDPARDVAGARAVGMRALHYVPAGGAPAAAAHAVLRRFGDLPGVVDRLA